MQGAEGPRLQTQDEITVNRNDTVIAHRDVTALGHGAELLHLLASWMLFKSEQTHTCGELRVENFWLNVSSGIAVLQLLAEPIARPGQSILLELVT